MVAVLVKMGFLSVCMCPRARERTSVRLSQHSNVDVKGMQKGGGAGVLLFVIHSVD